MDNQFSVTNLTVTASVGKTNNLYVIPKTGEGNPFSIYDLKKKGIEATLQYVQNGEATEEFLVIKELPTDNDNGETGEGIECGDFTYAITLEDNNWIDIMFDDKSKSIIVYQIKGVDPTDIKPKCNSTDSVYVSHITTLLYTVNLSIKKYVKIKVSSSVTGETALELITP